MKAATKSARSNNRSTITSVRLYPSVSKWLDKVSKKTARTKSYYINQALISMMNDKERVFLKEEVEK